MCVRKNVIKRRRIRMKKMIVKKDESLSYIFQNL